MRSFTKSWKPSRARPSWLPDEKSVVITVQPQLLRGDVDQEFVDAALVEGRIGWDIETTGLSWSRDRIGTCQLAIGGAIAVVQLDGLSEPEHLRRLLQDPGVLKIFHHAPFDLRFMAHHWGVKPQNVACTKIASKILEPSLDHSAHSLKPVLERYLGVVISKDQQRSDWASESLSDAQVAYAAFDVQFLVELYEHMVFYARRIGAWDLIRASYDYLPTRVQLDLSGASDVFLY